MANEVALTFSERFEMNLDKVAPALPKNLNKTRFIQNSLTVLNDNASLMKVNPNQLIAGLTKGAFLNLDFVNKECYLVPFGNTVQFLTSYKGDCKFVKQNSIRPVKDIYSKVVREGDFFEVAIVENDQKVNFRPKPFNNGAIVGVFAVVNYEDGGIEVETMSKEEVDNVRNNYSKMKNSKPWTASYDEMARKTVLKRLCKHIEIDFESAEARRSWDEADGNEFEGNVKKQRDDSIIDAFAEEVPQDVVDEADEVFG